MGEHFSATKLSGERQPSERYGRSGLYSRRKSSLTTLASVGVQSRSRLTHSSRKREGDDSTKPLAGHTDRFKTIINHAGVNNSYAQHGTDIPHGFTQVMGGQRWDPATLPSFISNSPITHVRNFKTATIVTFGLRDYCVPSGNGIELFGVLQSMGVPSRLVVFPDENHWILTPQNSSLWN